MEDNYINKMTNKVFFALLSFTQYRLCLFDTFLEEIRHSYKITVK